jgi:hypothetical protein
MTCSNTTGNPGMQYCTTDNILVDPIGIILATETLSFVAADFLLQDKMDDAVEARTAFPIMGLKDFVDNSTDTNYHDYNDETQKFIRQGKYRFQVMFEVNECVKKELQNFNGFNGRVFFVYEGTDKGVLRGSTTDAGVTVKGARIQQMVVVKETMPAKDGAPAMVTININLKTYKDLNAYDHARPVDYDVWELDSLTEVDLTQVGAASATEVVIGVNSTCYGVTNPITGLVIADFAITGTGTLSTLTDNADGTYTIVTIGLITTDTITLVAPAALSDSQKILSSGPVEITVT